MTLSLDEKYKLIVSKIKDETSTDPIEIVKKVMHQEFINMHGPEHHFLDGAAFLVAYKNAGGSIDLENALLELENRSIKMPGAMCGFWGVCGSSTSLGAALSIIHHTGPLSNDNFYKEHMEYIASVINKMSEIGGPRCCKRNAFISLELAIKFVEEKYQIKMNHRPISCEFTTWNQQCLKERCPFYKNKGIEQ